MNRFDRIWLMLPLVAFAVLPARAQVTIDVSKITCQQYVLFTVADPCDIADRNHRRPVDLKTLRKAKSIRTQPCEAAYPGNGPPCSAMPSQVMRSMFGIQASSQRLEWWSLRFCTTLKTPAGVSRPVVLVDTAGIATCTPRP